LAVCDVVNSDTGWTKVEIRDSQIYSTPVALPLVLSRFGDRGQWILGAMEFDLDLIPPDQRRARQIKLADQVAEAARQPVGYYFDGVLAGWLTNFGEQYREASFPSRTRRVQLPSSIESDLGGLGH
jgi:hypothetical protein